MHGPDGVRFCTKRKAITARWPQAKIDSNEPSAFIMSTMKEMNAISQNINSISLFSNASTLV
jgi:hypothetical protein